MKYGLDKWTVRWTETSSILGIFSISCSFSHTRQLQSPPSSAQISCVPCRITGKSSKVLTFQEHPGAAGHSLCGLADSGISNLDATSILCSPQWIIWFLCTMPDDLLDGKYSWGMDSLFRGQGKLGKSLSSFSHCTYSFCFQLVTEEAKLEGLSQTSAFHFSKPFCQDSDFTSFGNCITSDVV